MTQDHDNTPESLIHLMEQQTNDEEIVTIWKQIRETGKDVSNTLMIRALKKVVPAFINTKQISATDAIEEMCKTPEHELSIEILKTLLRLNISTDEAHQGMLANFINQLSPEDRLQIKQEVPNSDLFKAVSTLTSVSITGPHMNTKSTASNLSLSEALQCNAPKCTAIGNGLEQNIQDEQITSLQGMVNGKTTFFLNGHGGVSKGIHKISLSENSSPGSEKLLLIDALTPEATHTLVTSCYGGALKPSLKKDSEVVTIAEADNTMVFDASIRLYKHYISQDISFAQKYVNSFADCLDTSTFYHSLGEGERPFMFVYRPFHNKALLEPESAQILIKKAQQDFIEQYKAATGITLGSPPEISTQDAESLLEDRFILLYHHARKPISFFNDIGLKKFITKNSEFGSKLLMSSIRGELESKFGKGITFTGSTAALKLEPEKILDFGVNPNKPDKAGNLPLHIAIQQSHAQHKDIQALLKHGANPDLLDSNGNSPLRLALKKGDLSTVDLLISYNASLDTINASDLGNTEELFIKSMEVRHYNLTKTLLENKFIDSNTHLSQGLGLPIEYAWKTNNFKAMKILIDCGTNISMLPSPTQMIKSMIDADNPYQIQSLIDELKININTILIEGKSPISYALEHPSERMFKIITSLIISGEKIESHALGNNWEDLFKETLGVTYLHQDALLVIKAFIDSGVDINDSVTVNNINQTFLQYYVGKKSWSLVDALLSKGAKCDVIFSKDEAKTAFFDALHYKYFALVEALISSKVIDAGTPIESSTFSSTRVIKSKTLTPLKHVLRYTVQKVYTEEEALEVIKLLIKNGADPNLINEGEARSAKEIAEDAHFNKITLYFHQHEEDVMIKNLLTNNAPQATIDNILTTKISLDSLLLKEDIDIKMDTTTNQKDIKHALDSWIDQVVDTQHEIEARYAQLDSGDKSWNADMLKTQHELSSQIFTYAEHLHKSLQGLDSKYS